MSLKARRAVRTTKREGPITLAKESIRYVINKYRHPPTKEHIQYLQQKENLVIAEIGVWRGDNAEKLMSKLDVSKMYLIDPYDAYEEYEEDKSDVSKMQSARREAHNKLEKWENVNWIEKYSDEAVGEIDDNLDYVYVDGNHDYEFVKSDMENYHRLLNKGGILAGHDIDWEGVARAFVEFSLENDIQPHVEPFYPDWYFFKGKKIQS